MHALLEDEDSADEEFWNQDAFAEESGDERTRARRRKRMWWMTTFTTRRARRARGRCTWRKSERGGR